MLQSIIFRVFQTCSAGENNPESVTDIWSFYLDLTKLNIKSRVNLLRILQLFTKQYNHVSFKGKSVSVQPAGIS